MPAFDRPVLDDFDAVLNARRITRPRAAYRVLFAVFMVVAVLAVSGMLATLAAAPNWFESTGLPVFLAVCVADMGIAVAGMILVAVTARRDRAAEQIVQTALAADVQATYGFTVPAARMPLEVGQISQFEAVVAGEWQPVSLVLPAADQPLVLIPVKTMRPLLAGTAA